MIRRDLKAARDAWIDGANSERERAERKDSDFLRYVVDGVKYLDFHALRATFATNLDEVGASPKVTQDLTRHADPRTTAKHYQRPRLMSHLGALEMLPPVPTLTEAAAVTGTDSDAPGEPAGSE